MPLVNPNDLTGEVTSSNLVATLDKTVITNRGVVAVAGADLIIFGDASNANALARCTAQDIANLAAGGGLTVGKANALINFMALN